MHCILITLNAIFLFILNKFLLWLLTYLVLVLSGGRLVLLSMFMLLFINSSHMNRFIGNLDLCGRQVQKPCRTSLGFPVVLPHAESDEAEGKLNLMFCIFSNNAISSYNIFILILILPIFNQPC